MIIISILFSVIVLLVLLPSFIGNNKAALNEAEQSYLVREKNLKSDYQFRLKELKRRFKTGYYDEEDFSNLVNELDSEFAKSLSNLSQSHTQVHIAKGKMSLALTLILISLLAIGIYLKEGEMAYVQQKDQLTALLQQNPVAMTYLKQQVKHENNMENVKQLILASRIQIDLQPYNPAVWMEYGQLQQRLGRYQNAVDAMEKALQLSPNDSDIKLALAQTLPRLDTDFANKEADMMMQQVLASNPNNEKALLALGFNAFEKANYALAISSWEKVIAQRPANSKAVKLLQRSIATAKIKMKQLTNMEPSSAKGKMQATAQGSVQVLLSMGDELKKELNGNESIFVFAKALTGPPMPLAVKRYRASDLPVTLTLSDDNAMRPELKMSQFTNIYISAKLSKTGNVLSKEGDIVVKSKPIKAPYKNQKVVLKLIKTKR